MSDFWCIVSKDDNQDMVWIMRASELLQASAPTLFNPADVLPDYITESTRFNAWFDTASPGLHRLDFSVRGRQNYILTGTKALYDLDAEDVSTDTWCNAVKRVVLVRKVPVKTDTKIRGVSKKGALVLLMDGTRRLHELAKDLDADVPTVRAMMFAMHRDNGVGHGLTQDNCFVTLMPSGVRPEDVLKF